MTFEEQGKARFIKMGQFCGIKIDGIAAENMFKKYQEELTVSWKLFDDVEETLYALKEQKLGIISNGNAKQQQSKLICTEIDHYFEIKIFSEDVGVAKPNDEIFKRAIDLSKEESESIIYVGDNIKTDIFPCEKIGIKGILIDRNDEYSVKCCKIHSLVELKDYSTSLK